MSNDPAIRSAERQPACRPPTNLDHGQIISLARVLAVRRELVFENQMYEHFVLLMDTCYTGTGAFYCYQCDVAQLK
jgi:hypothetical protein